MYFMNVLLFILTISSGIIIVINHFMIKKFIIDKNNNNILADLSRSLFISFFTIFMIRGFIIGIFYIPSDSMFPTLSRGDFILVNKTYYGIKNPINNNILIHTNKPKNGDIIVFNFPVNNKVQFIKRIIGIPGDIISYENKNVIINGKTITKCEQHSNKILSCIENIEKISYNIIYNNIDSLNFKKIIIPNGMYFVMGDNRDNSDDSRYWGLVSENDIVGKAQILLFNWNNIGTFL